MKKSDLKTGMVVETRNGDKYLVMLNPDCKSRELIRFNGGYMPLYDYNDELEVQGVCFNETFDIMKVYSLSTSISWLLADVNKLKFKLIWERGERKEMTIEEIEEELGYEIKIVGDRNE